MGSAGGGAGRVDMRVAMGGRVDFVAEAIASATCGDGSGCWARWKRVVQRSGSVEGLKGVI